MEKQKNTGYKSVLNRELIQQNGGKVTYFQIIGLALIGIGIGYFTAFLITNTLHLLSPQGIAIAFFIIMLGVVFAFPDLLKGQTNEISTMRIIVFMLANVICMLLLKNGWQEGNLSDIGLDGYWMGVIALLFGAKAAQKYFENAKSLIPGSKTGITPTDNSEKKVQLDKIVIAQLAKIQNKQKLFEQFPSIDFISETLKDEDSCLTIYLKDDNSIGIPTHVNAKLNEETIIEVQTEIVTNIGKGKPHIGQLTNNISNEITPQFLGSICCFVESNDKPDFKGLITAGHVFTNGKFIDFDGFVRSNRTYESLCNGSLIGNLYFQQMLPHQDLAIVQLNENASIGSNMMTFPNGFYQVSPNDLNTPEENVTILSKDNNERDAFILGINISRRIYYTGTQKIMRNIILIGSDTDKDKSTTLSVPGDSGSCVYHKESKKLIGILMGGDDKFSFVLPIEYTLTSNNFTLK